MENYIFGKYGYFDILVKINALYFPDIYMIRNESFSNFINITLKKLFYVAKYSTNLDSTIAALLNTMGIIWYLQPFLDGNTRTLNTFIVLFLKALGYDVVLSPQDIKNIIPIFYTPDETCSEQHILYLKKIIAKKSH